MMWFGWGFRLFAPLCLVLIAVVIYYFVTSLYRRETCSHQSHIQQAQYSDSRAIDILKERYAKGEITKEQFLKMKDELR